jgi:hypothetical protein
MLIPKIFFRRPHSVPMNRDELSTGVFAMRLIIRPLFTFLTGLVLVAGFGAGCDKNPLGTVENNGHAPGNHAPFLSSPALSPASVYIDSLTPSAGVYSFAVIVRVTATDADGADDIVGVNAALLPPGESTPGPGIPLLDNGVLPDSTAGDGVYMARIQFGVARSEAGVYRVQISATDRTGLASNGVDLPLEIRRRNSPPSLSGLVAPDTVTLPVGGMIVVLLSVAASDSDGLGDIQQVYFRSLTSSNPTFKFSLKDDGSTDPPPIAGWPSSGDLVAGDGIYTIRIPLVDGQSQRRTNTFAFQAVDRFGDTSATVIHYLTVQ